MVHLARAHAVNAGVVLGLEFCALGLALLLQLGLGVNPAKAHACVVRPRLCANIEGHPRVGHFVALAARRVAPRTHAAFAGRLLLTDFFPGSYVAAALRWSRAPARNGAIERRMLLTVVSLNVWFDEGAFSFFFWLRT